MNLQELEQAWCCASSYMKNSLVFYGLPRRSDDGELFIFWLDLPGIDKKTMLMLTQHTAFWLDLPGIDKKTMLMLTQHTAFWLDLPGIDKKTMLMLTQHTAFWLDLPGIDKKTMLMLTQHTAFWLDLPGIDKKTMLMLTQHTAFRGAKTIPTRTGELNCKLRKGDTKHFSKNHQRNNNIRRIHTRTHAHTIYMKRERAHETEGIRSSYTRPQRTLFDEPYNYIHTYNYAGSPIRSN